MEAGMNELVMAARRGEQWAFARLYEKTYQKAYYMALQLLKDEDEAQDILHDSYIKAFKSLNALESAERFESWFDRIVINKCKDYLKKKKPLIFSQMLPDDSSGESVDWEDTKEQFSPEKEIDYQETKRLIQEMIDELPDQQRIAMILHYLEDMPVTEIARMMECSEGTIKSRLNYGRKAIKEKVLIMEKKGTKLYCMPLVPFLYWMFRNNALSVLLPVKFAEHILAGADAVDAGAGNAAAARSTVSIGNTAETGSAAAAGGAATVVVKIAAVVTAASVCAGVFLAAGKMGGSSIHAQQEALATTIEATVKGTAIAETEVIETTIVETATVETTKAIIETAAEGTYDGRKRYYALTIEDIIEQLKAESKLEELTFIVFNRFEKEYFLLEDGDSYDISIAETFLVYCSTATDFKQDVPSYKKITAAYRWNANQTAAEVYLKDFDGAVDATFMKKGNPDISKTIALSLDKSLQNGEWSYDDYVFSHMYPPVRN